MKLEKQNPVITPKGCFFFWMLLRENSINNIADKEENVLAYLGLPPTKRGNPPLRNKYSKNS